MPAHPIILGHLSFASKAETISHFKHILAISPDYEPLAGQVRVDVEALLCNHEHAQEKIGSGIADLFVAPHPENNSRCFHIFHTDGTFDDFGYKKALDGETKPRIRFMQAARATIADDIQAFKSAFFDQNANAQGFVILGNPGQTYSRGAVHVDHNNPPFRAIADDFLATEGLDPAIVAYDTTGLVGTHLRDGALAARFRAYHNTRANLRILPAAENLRTAWLARADSSTPL